MSEERIRKIITDRIWKKREGALAVAKHSAAGAPPKLTDRDFLEDASLDMGYGADRIRERLALDGIEPVSPLLPTRCQKLPFDKERYRGRNRVPPRALVAPTVLFKLL